ncbi:MAG: transglycosylase SLT domain-containing protein [Alphaproteobacteria bacterium]
MKAAIAGFALLACISTLASGPAAGASIISLRSNDLCAAIIQHTESAKGIPARLLGAISLAESGRRDPRTKAVIAWPWTVNAGGDARYYATKAQAVAGVRRLKARGVRNIDVGCMQVNLMHHPKAFASLSAAFDPATNVAYAAHYLKKLHGRTGSWVSSVASYHSGDVRRGHPYMLRVLKIWMARPGRARPTQLARLASKRQPGSAHLASRSPRGNWRSASLVRRAASLGSAKPRRKWKEVVARRKRFAELLGRRLTARRATRRAGRRAGRDPS